ncbi:MAG: DUF3987 domain-containing protein [Pseudomonadota bacterium]|nr:DUF3987 domain-containing protein [Pseudomonadota bacterium]
MNQPFPLDSPSLAEFQQAVLTNFAGEFAKKFHLTGIYPYRKENGTILFIRVRLDKSGEPKFIRPLYFEHGQFVVREPNQAAGKILYGIYEASTHPDAVILVTEGEMKADAITRIGGGQFVGVTSGGAQSADKAIWEVLEGRTVHIWRDFDEAGRTYETNVAAKLSALGCNLQFVDVEALQLPVGGDVIDWLAARSKTTASPPSAEVLLSLPLLSMSQHHARQSEASAGFVISDLSSQAWPAIRPLPKKGLLPVMPFTMDLIPKALQPWIADIAVRMQCPPDYLAVVLFGVLGTIVGRRVGVRPKARDSWTVFANMWVMIVGRPATMKSPSTAEVMKPLVRLETIEYAKFVKAMQIYEGEKREYDDRSKGLSSQRKKQLAADPFAVVEGDDLVEPLRPVQRRFLVNDATPEILHEICIDNPQGLCVYRDELVSLIKTMDQVGHESERGLYLSGWNGDDPYVVDRCGRGRNLRAEAVNISVIGGTQPGPLSAYVREALVEGEKSDGFLQRFGMMVMPDIPEEWEYVDKYPDFGAIKRAFTLLENLARANPIDDWGATHAKDYKGDSDFDRPPFLRLSEVAQEMFVEWLTNLETLLRTDLQPAKESHFAKYRKLIPAIALLSHVADGGTGPINGVAMKRAIRWADYLMTHADRVYGMMGDTPVDRAEALLQHIQRGDFKAGTLTAKDVYSNDWSLLGSREEAQQAIDVLCTHGYLTSAPDQEQCGPGRPPAVRYLINPRVHDGTKH